MKRSLAQSMVVPPKSLSIFQILQMWLKSTQKTKQPLALRLSPISQFKNLLHHAILKSIISSILVILVAAPSKPIEEHISQPIRAYIDLLEIENNYGNNSKRINARDNLEDLCQ